MSKINYADFEAVPERAPLFSVTVRAVVGTVYAGGEFAPRQAAFLLIADSGQEGIFEFPTEDGGIETVTVAIGSAILDVRSGAPTSQDRRV